MSVRSASAPFGGRTRTRVLLLLRLLGRSHPRELARVLDQSLSSVQRALHSLERDALVVAQSVGRTRQFQLNPAYFARLELTAYLTRLADADRDLNTRAEAVRRRPRLTGKPL